MRILSALCMLLIFNLPCVAMGSGDTTSPVKVFTSEEPFEDVVENIKMAIIEQGLLVSGTLHVSDMLNRTAPDLGYPEIFAKAESVEFCSALLSHKMAQAAAENIAICPFTIAVYKKQADPDRVYLAYRVPSLAGSDDRVAAEIITLLEQIIEDSI
ncbi:MAG: hypothetical protein G8D61_10740 [gamma proteobacterium symbiont of Ctena orbiculata]|nr:hypothetical protein [Candidatus Thiodiazotropha taylori]MBT3057929.1 hypothetical protein [Candidatus Thiodiazotropha sp. (ex Lucina pensylvanica)]MBV2096492.1 hypothetical protein [Candidatus Thiodiazotropha sp. (ex Codakia orbicularis)]PUB77851.1 MAG: hypothetical protein DBP03_02745 [gamma proteobacterium symbiont of Ctena orbiculata]MBT3061968.1 hypothetical protein [Candidatus Thiodiazotropha sp. (ex Lucina pensylvanica)]